MGLQFENFGDLAGSKKTKKKNTKSKGSVTPNLDKLKAARMSAGQAAAKLNSPQSSSVAAPVKKKKKKKGIFGKLTKAAKKVGGIGKVISNPLVKVGLGALPGGGAISAAMDLAKSGNKQKAKEAMESPEYLSAEQELENKVREMAPKYGVNSAAEMDEILKGLASAKTSGKLVKGSPDDQILAAYVATQVAEADVNPEGGGNGLLIGGGIAALLFLL